MILDDIVGKVMIQDVEDLESHDYPREFTRLECCGYRLKDMECHESHMRDEDANKKKRHA